MHFDRRPLSTISTHDELYLTHQPQSFMNQRKMLENEQPGFVHFMQQHAQQAITIGRKYFNMNLDGSEESIKSMDLIIDALRDQDIANSNLFHDAIYAFGAYFGEVIRQHYANISWLKDHPRAGDNVMALSLDGDRDCIFPLSMCMKRLQSEDEDRLWSKYEMIFLKPMTPLPENVSRSAPPPLPPQ